MPINIIYIVDLNEDETIITINGINYEIINNNKRDNVNYIRICDKFVMYDRQNKTYAYISYDKVNNHNIIDKIKATEKTYTLTLEGDIKKRCKKYQCLTSSEVSYTPVDNYEKCKYISGYSYDVCHSNPLIIKRYKKQNKIKFCVKPYNGVFIDDVEDFNVSKYKNNLIINGKLYQLTYNINDSDNLDDNQNNVEGYNYDDEHFIDDITASVYDGETKVIDVKCSSVTNVYSYVYSILKQYLKENNAKSHYYDKIYVVKNDKNLYGFELKINEN